MCVLCAPAGLFFTALVGSKVLGLPPEDVAVREREKQVIVVLAQEFVYRTIQWHTLMIDEIDDLVSNQGRDGMNQPIQLTVQICARCESCIRHRGRSKPLLVFALVLSGAGPSATGRGASDHDDWPGARDGGGHAARAPGEPKAALALRI
jgi:hypothetical protein